MLDQGDDRLRRTFGVNYVSAVNLAGIRRSFEILQRAVGLRLRKAALDARGAAGMRFQVTGRAESDDFSVIDDAPAIAEPLGLLDIVRGHYNRFFLPFQLFDDVVNLSPHLGIEAGGRLLEKQE